MNMNCKSCTGGSALAEKLVLWYIPLAFAALFIWGSVLQMRSFVINDPNGVHLYIYKSIPPTPDYQRIYDSFKK